MSNTNESTKFISFPAGIYTVGPSKEAMEVLEKVPVICERAKTAKVRTIEVEAFCLAEFLVTNAEFEQIFPNHRRCAESSEDNQPVVDITYFEALIYCKKQGCRLPTSDEWSIAAGGQTGLAAANYSEPDALYQNFFPSKGANCKGVYPPNPFGLYDLCGNVFELTNSIISVAEHRAIDIIRGGSWGTCKYGCYAFLEGYLDTLIRSNRVGFRLARSI